MMLVPILLAWLAADLSQAPACANEPVEIKPPAFTHKVEPGYTPEARAKKIQGITKLSIQITPEGSTDQIGIVKSLDPGLDANAVEAVRQWKFRPATKAGKPVRVTAVVDVEFRMPTHPEIQPPADTKAAEVEEFWRYILP
jgi:TonB family protein